MSFKAAMKHKPPLNEKFIDADSREFFILADEAQVLIDRLLIQFNARKTKLFDLPSAQRIFLFILTRSIKTYASIVLLCRDGYGQDVATLLRGLLENLITARYILHDPKTANHLAERFVAYKWIIFKRSLPEQEQEIKNASQERKKEFFKRKSLIMDQVAEFKGKFAVASDRGLLTWSGKTVRDMARCVDAYLPAEYDLIFRQCSKFSHPSILGDHEYLVQDNKDLIFSPRPSPIGVVVNLRKAIEYFLEFAQLINEQFQLQQENELDNLKAKYSNLFKPPNIQPQNTSSDTLAKPAAVPIRECNVVFKVDLNS